MKLNQYQELAQRTVNSELDKDTRLAVAALGLTGESGEVADHVKKHLGHGHKLDRDYLIKEIGDAFWYLAELSACLDVTLEEVAQANVLKLEKRYPSGFSEEASINRVD